jgi:hypothetical protein
MGLLIGGDWWRLESRCFVYIIYCAVLNSKGYREEQRVATLLFLLLFFGLYWC